jgi:hypothetical protein
MQILKITCTNYICVEFIKMNLLLQDYKVVYTTLHSDVCVSNSLLLSEGTHTRINGTGTLFHKW